jgi:hypothetical protein
VALDYSRPGKPTDNAFIKGGQDFATQRLWTCNDERPNIGVGGMSPAQKLNAAAQSSRNDPRQKMGILMLGVYNFK